MSAALARTTTLDGWTLAFVSADGEPLFRDLDLAERAELKDPHDIRRAIATAIKNGDILIPGDARNGETCIAHEVVESVAIGGGRRRDVTTYYLDEEGALEVLMRLRTPAARALRRQVRQVYLAWRRGSLDQVRQSDATTMAAGLMAHGVQVRQHRILAESLWQAIKLLASARERSLQWAHGQVRVLYGVPSYKSIPLPYAQQARETVLQMAFDKKAPPAIAATRAANQLSLFGKA